MNNTPSVHTSADRAQEHGPLYGRDASADSIRQRTKLLIQWAGGGIVRSRLTETSASRVVVLCYHSVDPNKRFATTPAAFEAQLGWLKVNCEQIAFSEVFQALSRRRPKLPAVAITFDDGYRDNFEYAFPLLQKYGFTATFFATTGLIEGDPSVVSRFRLIRRSTAEDICSMSWSQLRQMISAGMDVGVHTYSHPKLAQLDRGEVWAELTFSKRLMEERLGRAITAMAYPYGKPQRHWNSGTLRLAVDAGYLSAGAVLFRNVRDRDCPLAIPRITIANDNVTTLRDKVYGAWDFVGIWQEKCPIWLARLSSPRDFRPVPGFAGPFLTEP